MHLTLLASRRSEISSVINLLYFNKLLFFVNSIIGVLLKNRAIHIVLTNEDRVTISCKRGGGRFAVVVCRAVCPSVCRLHTNERMWAFIKYLLTSCGKSVTKRFTSHPLTCHLDSYYTDDSHLHLTLPPTNFYYAHLHG